MPATEGNITSPPPVPGNNYDSADHGPVGKWVKPSGSGPGWTEGSGDFESTPPWQQT
jgi:hypothetical protein